MILIKTNITITSSSSSIYPHYTFKDNDSHHLHEPTDVEKGRSQSFTSCSFRTAATVYSMLLFRFCYLDQKLILNFCSTGMLLPEKSWLLQLLFLFPDLMKSHFLMTYLGISWHLCANLKVYYTSIIRQIHWTTLSNTLHELHFN